MIGGAVLVVGLLLILTGLASARIPGDAAFASPGMSNSAGPRPDPRVPPLPIHPATWYANASIGIGFFVGIVAFAALASIASAGFAALLAGIGVLFIAIAIEGARLVARIERRRVMLGSQERLRAHPYRPLRGGIVAILRAEFLDESRWRDVLYVAVNLPLAIIEFAVIAAVWTLSISLLTMPFWYDALGGREPAGVPRRRWRGTTPRSSSSGCSPGVALLPVAASLSQLVMVLHRAVVVGAAVHVREPRAPAPGADAQGEPIRRSRRRGERAAPDRARPARRRPAAARHADHGPGPGERADRHRSGGRAGSSSSRGRSRPVRPWPSCATWFAALRPSILLDRGLVPALGSIAGRGPVPTVVRSELPDGERLPASIERAAYFVVAEALANVAKHSGARGVRGPLPAGRVAAGRRGPG